MEKDIDSLSAEELGQLFPISISESNSEWPELYVREKKRLVKLLGNHGLTRVEHFGSTAVPGLAAKPTIDMLAEIREDEHTKQEIIHVMKTNGYHFILRTDRPPPYLMFVKGYTSEGFRGQCYHIHMAPKNHNGLWERLYFRDYLIAHPETAKEYENLKRALAIKYKYNREKYTDAKKDFVQRITEVAKWEIG